MIATCSCPSCGQRIEYETQNAGSAITCPKCGKTLTLPAAAVAPPPVAAPVVPVTVTIRSARDYLSKLRQNTCYGMLRGIINLIFFFGIVAIIIADVGSYNYWQLVATAFAPAGASPTIVTTIAIVLLIFATLISISILVALRQAAFLLIDIADSLINQGSRY